MNTLPVSALPPIGSLIRVEAATRPSVGGHVLHEATEHVATTRWLRLQTVSYVLPHDNETPPNPRKWNMATRPTITNDDSKGRAVVNHQDSVSNPDLNSDTSRNPKCYPMRADAVAVIARLTLADDEPRIILVKQYRPPVDAITLELPAGLIDDGETPDQAALRELCEETGFTGSVTAVHQPSPLSPGMTDELIALVEVDIHGAETRAQTLDPSENIHAISVPIARLSEALSHFQKEGVLIMHAVSTLAVGLSSASTLRAI